jgi:hypothetical protein
MSELSIQVSQGKVARHEWGRISKEIATKKRDHVMQKFKKEASFLCAASHLPTPELMAVSLRNKRSLVL